MSCRAVAGGFFVAQLFLAVTFDEFMKTQSTDVGVSKATSAEVESGAQQQQLPTVKTHILQGTPGDDGLSADLGCCSCQRSDATSWYRWLASVVTSETFNRLSTGLVIFNVFVMCMPYASQPQRYADALELASATITVLFMVEMTMKLIALGCGGYWKDDWNKLDGIIVLLSALDLGLTLFSSGGGGANEGGRFSFVRMLRILRLLRVLRLMRSWKELYRIVHVFVKSFPMFCNLFLLFFIINVRLALPSYRAGVRYVFWGMRAPRRFRDAPLSVRSSPLAPQVIFALVGMQLFGGKFTEEAGFGEGEGLEEKPRQHFDYFMPAMITVFMTLIGGWVDPFSECAGVAGLVPSSLFYVAAIVVGFFVILNMFISILLEAFVDEREEEAALDDDAPPPETLPQLDPQSPQGYSLFCFSPANRWRRMAITIVESEAFDRVMIFVIVISSVCLALDVPRLDAASELAWWLVRLNLVLTAVFILEFILKVRPLPKHHTLV